MASASRQPQLGLLFWMRRVVEETSRARAAFDEEAVHDLRVAIRRCRSMAEVFRALDPDSAWRKMRRAGKVVFSALGELRDVQVQRLWIEELHLSGSGAGRLRAHFAAREQQLKQSAAGALDAFDSTQWLQWGEILDRRQARILPGSPAFQAVAAETWQAARRLHQRAMRRPTAANLHALRIGVKRFRYVAENFLPDYHQQHGKQLKKAQDLLGELHDLEVLRQTAATIGAFPDAGERAAFEQVVERESARRLAGYRRMAVGNDGAWRQWRLGLPRGAALAEAVQQKFACWAAFRDADMRHAQRVLRFARKILDALTHGGWMSGGHAGVSHRGLLAAAILGHEAAAWRGKKKARREWEHLGAPAGWTARELRIAGLVARYHRGSLPSPQHKIYAELTASDRRLVDRLAAIVRLADALGAQRAPVLRLGRVRFLAANGGRPQMVIPAGGYSARSHSAERITRASHFLQVVFEVAVVVRGRSQ